MGIPNKEQVIFLQTLFNILDVDSGKLLNCHKIVFNDKFLFIAYNEILQKKSGIALLKKSNWACLTFTNFQKFKILTNKLKSLSYTQSSQKKMFVLQKTFKYSFLLAAVPMIDQVREYSIYFILTYIYKGSKVSLEKKNNLVVSYKARFGAHTQWCAKGKSVYSVLNDLRS